MGMSRTLRTRYGSALGQREFRYLLGAFQVSLLGDSAAYVAVTVLVYRYTGSALLSALVFTVAFTPYLVGGTLLSGLIDRIAPRRLLVTADLAGALLACGMALRQLPVAALLVLLFTLSVLAPVTQGCRTALVAEVCPGDAFVPAASLLRISAQTSQVFGNALAGALLAALSPRGALAADAATFVLSAALTRIGLRERPATGRAGQAMLLRDSLAGVRHVLALPRLRRVLAFSWLVPFIATAPEALAAPAVSQLHLQSSWVGWWLMSVPAGVVTGDLIGMWLVPPAGWRRLAWPLALVQAAVLLPFGLRPPVPAALVLLLAVGATSGYGLGVQQLLLDTTPEQLRGRMFAVASTGLMVSQGIGFVTAGAIGQFLHAGTTIAVFGACGLFTLALVRLPGIKAQQARRDDSSHQQNGSFPQHRRAVPADAMHKQIHERTEP
jgi:predicted MFS family arabinose efflux permease